MNPDARRARVRGHIYAAVSAVISVAVFAIYPAAFTAGVGILILMQGLLYAFLTDFWTDYDGSTAQIADWAGEVEPPESDGAAQPSVPRAAVDHPDSMI